MLVLSALLKSCVPMQVIMATNRADTLDPALLRPGRLDRKIEFPMPDRRQKRLVFQVCSGNTHCWSWLRHGLAKELSLALTIMLAGQELACVLAD